MKLQVPFPVFVVALFVVWAAHQVLLVQGYRRYHNLSQAYVTLEAKYEALLAEEAP